MTYIAVGDTINIRPLCQQRVAFFMDKKEAKELLKKLFEAFDENVKDDSVLRDVSEILQQLSNLIDTFES